MKSNRLFIITLTCLTLITACVSSESEMLKQARSIQNELLSQVDALDSTMTVKLTSMNTEQSTLSMDSTMATDSTKMKLFMMGKEKIDNLSALQSELTDWRSNITLLPSVDEMSKGAENPFGEKAKDQDILAAIKKSQEAFNSLRMKAEAAMK